MGGGSWIQNNVALMGVPVSPPTAVRKPGSELKILPSGLEQVGPGLGGGGTRGAVGALRLSAQPSVPLQTVQSQPPPLAS